MDLVCNLYVTSWFGSYLFIHKIINYNSLIVQQAGTWNGHMTLTLRQNTFACVGRDLEAEL